MGPIPIVGSTLIIINVIITTYGQERTSYTTRYDLSGLQKPKLYHFQKQNRSEGEACTEKVLQTLQKTH